MLTSVNGNLKGFCYENGYLRTSSALYEIGNFSDKTVHLTNDSIQKASKDYGSFEEGNKVEYNDF